MPSIIWICSNLLPSNAWQDNAVCTMYSVVRLNKRRVFDCGAWCLYLSYPHNGQWFVWALLLQQLCLQLVIQHYCILTCITWQCIVYIVYRCTNLISDSAQCIGELCSIDHCNGQWTVLVVSKLGKTAAVSFQSNGLAGLSCNCILGAALLYFGLYLHHGRSLPFMCALRTRAWEDVSCTPVVVAHRQFSARAIQSKRRQSTLFETVHCVRLPGILTPLPLPSNQQPFLGSSISENQKGTSPLYLELWEFISHHILTFASFLTPLASAEGRNLNRDQQNWRSVIWSEGTQTRIITTACLMLPRSWFWDLDCIGI